MVPILLRNALPAHHLPINLQDHPNLTRDPLNNRQLELELLFLALLRGERVPEEAH